MILTKVKLKKNGFEFINLENITTIDILPARYEVNLTDRARLFVDKEDVVITGLVDAAKSAYVAP